MKILYIASKQKNLSFALSKQEILKLPKTLFLAYSVQYKDLANRVKAVLESSRITIEKFQQVLGCSTIKTSSPILLVGTGRFHALNLYLQAPAIYVLENNRIIQIPKKEIDELRAKRRTALMKFLKSENIGILVTTKPGQENLTQAIKLKERLEKQGKQTSIFLSNNIDITQFENFHIGSWVNTACSGLAMDNSDIINISELPKK
jgi:diphthamide biosynthesis enzyme Dph1/Dph2-like protein